MTDKYKLLIVTECYSNEGGSAISTAVVGFSTIAEAEACARQVEVTFQSHWSKHEAKRLYDPRIAAESEAKGKARLAKLAEALQPLKKVLAASYAGSLMDTGLGDSYEHGRVIAMNFEGEALLSVKDCQNILTALESVEAAK